MPVDWQLTDTYFVVAHIHYVLIGINVFPVIGRVYFWFPKITGRLMNERLGKWNFWVMFVGFNFGFFPMHITGLLGMPRRIYTYPAGIGWDWPEPGHHHRRVHFRRWHPAVHHQRADQPPRGAVAGPNPWDAPTLEWATTSPPPPYNFAVLPSVASRHPLWEDRLDEGDGESVLERGLVLDHHHETLAVTAMDGVPDLILKMPSETYLPLIHTLCLSMFFAGLVSRIWGLAGAGAILAIVVAIIWLWPRAEVGQREMPADV